MLVSVVLPTYNRAHELPRALKSVASQSYENWELIVVDDGSTDHTRALLAEWTQIERPQKITVIQQPNSGVSAARNRGVERASGQWIAFLDSDDEWLPEKLSQQMPLTKDFRWIHGEEIWIRNGRRVNAMNKHRKSGGRIFKRCVDLCCVSPSATLLHKETLLELGGFREDFTVCEDYDLWLRFAARFPAGFIETPIVQKFGGHEDQLSRRFVGMDYFRCLSLQEQLTNPYISNEEREHVSESLFSRLAILEQGYEKHGGQEWPWPVDFKDFIASHRAHSAAARRPRSESSGVL